MENKHSPTFYSDGKLGEEGKGGQPYQVTFSQTLSLYNHTWHQSQETLISSQSHVKNTYTIHLSIDKWLLETRLTLLGRQR